MTIKAAFIMALIAIGVIVATPRPGTTARWVITDQPSDANSLSFRLRGGLPASEEIYRIDKHGRLTVHLRHWERVCPCATAF